MKRYELQNHAKTLPIFSTKSLSLLSWEAPWYLSRQISEWADKWMVIALKKWLSMLWEHRWSMHSFLIANKVCEPSYISCESALSYRNMIPEWVMTTTSVTTKKTQQYTNATWTYCYQSITPQAFGWYTLIDGYFIATPEKALLDYLWFHQDILNEHLLESLRLNIPNTFTLTHCKKYLMQYPYQSFRTNVKRYFFSCL